MMKGCVLFLSLGEKFNQIVKCTNNVKDITGYDEAELKNKSIKDIMPASIADQHDYFLNNFLKKAVIGTQEIHLFLK